MLHIRDPLKWLYAFISSLSKEIVKQSIFYVLDFISWRAGDQGVWYVIQNVEIFYFLASLDETVSSLYFGLHTLIKHAHLPLSPSTALWKPCRIQLHPFSFHLLLSTSRWPGSESRLLLIVSFPPKYPNNPFIISLPA